MVIIDKFLSLCNLSLVKCKLRALQTILVLSLCTPFLDEVEWSEAIEAISHADPSLRGRLLPEAILHTKMSLRGFRRNPWQSPPLFFKRNVKVTL